MLYRPEPETFPNERVIFSQFMCTFSPLEALDKVSHHVHIERYSPDGKKYLVLKNRTFYEYHAEIARKCTELDRTHHRYPARNINLGPQLPQQELFDVNTDVQAVINHMQSVTTPPAYEDGTWGWLAKRNKRSRYHDRQESPR